MLCKQPVVLFVLLLLSVSTAESQENEKTFLYQFLEGRYHLIGQWMESDSTYQGTMLIQHHKKRFKIERFIDGRRIMGKGQIEFAGADSIAVLRIRFRRHDNNYEATYQIDSDLDNYGRLSGYIYLKNRRTKQPGLEALFFDKKKF